MMALPYRTKTSVKTLAGSTHATIRTTKGKTKKNILQEPRCCVYHGDNNSRFLFPWLLAYREKSLGRFASNVSNVRSVKVGWATVVRFAAQNMLTKSKQALYILSVNHLGIIFGLEKWH